MANWKRKIKLKHLLGSDTSDEAAKEAARAVSAILKRQPEYEEDGIDDFSQAVNEMADIAASDDDPSYTTTFTRTRHFNLCLDAVYDWADAERVWID